MNQCKIYKRLLRTFSVGALLFIACTVDRGALSGRWQAVALYEDGQNTATPLDSVSLFFSEDGTYSFRSIGFYREAGYFHTNLRYLTLRDTTAETATEHTLAVQHLSDDTLKLEMGKNGKSQVLFLCKLK
jgi:hypothetical protein